VSRSRPVGQPVHPDMARRTSDSLERGSKAFARKGDAAAVALVAIVAVGAILRAVQFLSGRSLWHDEALLSLDLIGRSLGDTLGRLDFAQAAPAGYMLAELGVARAAGNSEESLRLLSLVAGVAALALFAVLARRILGPWAAVVATLAFAAADGLVAYSSQLKPYSSDVLVTVVLLLLGLAAQHRPLTRRRALAIGAGGAVAVLFSFPSVFVALSVAVVLLLPGRANGWRESVQPRLPIVALWGLAVLGIALDSRLRAQTVRDAFESDSAAFGGSSGNGVEAEWLDKFVSGILHSVGFAQERPLSHLAKIAVVALAVGLVSLTRRRPAVGAMLALPFLAAGLASLLHLYPLTSRTTLFLLPPFVLLVADGVWWPARRIRGRVGVAIAAAAAVAVLAFPLYSAAYHVVHPRTTEELRPVLEELRRAWRPGDTLYLHPGAQYAFRYYADCDCLDPRSPRLDELVPFARVNGDSTRSPAIKSRSAALVVGRRVATDARLLRDDLAPLRGRVWFVYSHSDIHNERLFFETEVPRVLDGLGTRLATVERPGAAALLYELS